MSFQKIDKINYAMLPLPDDSLFFFEEFKRISEQYWETITLNTEVYGYQIQPGSKWRAGLSDAELLKFENETGFLFPQALRNFYKVMNGLDRPGVDAYDNKPEFRSVFYSYPDDLDLITEMTSWIYEENLISRTDSLSSGISRIFPVFAHRFMMVDIPGNPVLSMWGDDIIYWADNIGKLLIKDIFRHVLSANNYNKLILSQPEIKFWLDQA
jgi:hypothetical protein